MENTNIYKAQQKKQVAAQLTGLKDAGKRKEYAVALMALYHSSENWKILLSKELLLKDLEKYIWRIMMSRFRTYASNYSEDLYMSAACAVLEAMGQYDPESSPSGSLTTYFKYPIIHGMNECISRQVDLASPYQSKCMQKVSHALTSLSVRGIQEPTVEVISQECGLSPLLVREAQTALRVKHAACISGISVACIADRPCSEDIESSYLRKENRMEILRCYVGKLDRESARLINLVFGLSGKAPMTLKQAAVIVGVPYSRAYSMKTRAIQTLRHMPGLYEHCSQC